MTSGFRLTLSVGASIARPLLLLSVFQSLPSEEVGFYFMAGCSYIQLSPTQAVEALTFADCGKSKQKHACATGPKEETNHRFSLHRPICFLPFLLTFAVCLRKFLSVIVSFLLSASRVFFSAHLCLKQLSSLLTATFRLSPNSVIVNHALLSLPFTIFYSDSRWSLVGAFL